MIMMRHVRDPVSFATHLFLGGGWEGGLLYMPERKYDQEQSPQISQIFITWQAFSALKESGNVISWGNESDGGPQGQQCEFVEIL